VRIKGRKKRVIWGEMSVGKGDSRVKRQQKEEIE
jgi:hypothetical protein